VLEMLIEEDFLIRSSCTLYGIKSLIARHYGCKIEDVHLSRVDEAKWQVCLNGLFLQKVAVLRKNSRYIFSLIKGD
jgi:hypothetical protein